MTDSDDTTTDERPRAPAEYRSVPSSDFEVRWADRIIEMVAMPYDREAVAEVRGRVVTESCAPGAFEGVKRRERRVTLNRDHDVHRIVGKCLALHPSRTEGLVAEMRIADSTDKWSLGDETLALAASGVLEPSVSFRVMPRGEEWSPDRKRRRLKRVFLEHIAMVPEGAYADGDAGARVLEVRSADGTVRYGSVSDPIERAPVATPNLDAVLLWQRQHGIDR